jgi:hypothetical protein
MTGASLYLGWAAHAVMSYEENGAEACVGHDRGGKKADDARLGHGLGSPEAKVRPQRIPPVAPSP